MPERFEICSRLNATPAEVWSVVSTMRGVNDELAPLMRMTHPKGMESLHSQEVPLGVRLFRSWLLLFGFLPVDYDDLVLVELRPGHGFHERSTMLSMKTWEHERWIEAASGGCDLHDHVTFNTRIAVAAPVLRVVIKYLFDHRHERLRLRFNGLRLAPTRAPQEPAPDEGLGKPPSVA